MSKHTISKIGHELADYARVRAALEGRGDLDAKTLADTLEGATDLPEAILAASEQIGEYDAMLAGLSTHIADLTARKSRLTNSRETLRTVILQAMDRAGIETITGPACTLVARKTPPQPIIGNEADIPADYWQAMPPKLDKDMLALALAEGPVPGVSLSNGGLSLTVRIK